MGRVHFVVMWAEVGYLYVAMAASVNNWDSLRRDDLAWRSYLAGWLALGLFVLCLVADVVRFSR